MAPALLPEALGFPQRVNAHLLPPAFLCAMIVQGAVVQHAERHRPLVADFPAKRPRLGKTQMMCLARRASANEAGLRGNEPPMGLVPHPLRHRDRQFGFVDAAGRLLGRAFLIGSRQSFPVLQEQPGRRCNASH